MKHINLIIRAGLGHGLAIATTLVFSILCARLLNTSEFGELRYAMTLLPLLMAFNLPGFDTVILRTSSRRARLPLKRIMRARVIGGAIGSLVLLLLIVTDILPHEQPLLFFLVCIMVALPFFEVGSGYKNFLLGTRLRKSGLRLFIRARSVTLGILLFAAALIVLQIMPSHWLFPAWLLAMGLPGFFVFRTLAARQHKPKRCHPPTQIRQAMITTLAGVIGTLAFSLDKLMIRHGLGAEALAAYAILVMFPTEMARLLDAMIPVFYRQIFFASRWNMPNGLTSLRLFVIIGSLGVIGLFVYAALFHWAAPLVFGPAYQYDYIAIVLSALLAVTGGFEYFTVHRVFAMRGGQMYFAFMISGVILCALLYTFAIPQAGLMGVLIALNAKQLLLSLVFFRLSPHKVYLP